MIDNKMDMCMVSKYSSIICSVCLSVTSPALLVMVYFDTYYKDASLINLSLAVG